MLAGCAVHSPRAFNETAPARIHYIPTGVQEFALKNDVVVCDDGKIMRGKFFTYTIGQTFAIFCDIWDTEFKLSI